MASFGVPSSPRQYQQQRSGQATGAYNPNVDPNKITVPPGFFMPQTLADLLNSSEYQQYGRGNNTQAYDEAYQNAINQSRANITQMFGAALQDIQNRQNIGDQAIGQLPGQITQAYAPAEKSVQDNAVAAQQAQDKSGLTSFLPASAISQPATTAMETSQAAHQADVPVLHLAMNNEFGKERTSVQTQQAQALADLAQKEADAALSKQQQDEEPTWMQKLLVQNFMDQQTAKQNADAKKQQALVKQKQQILQGMAKISPRVDASNGKTLANNAAFSDTVNGIRAGGAGRASGAYAEAFQQLQVLKNKYHDPAKGAKHIKAFLKQIHGKYPKQASAISLALYDAGIQGGL